MTRHQAMERHPAGKGIPESPEVRQARQDDEAVALANSNRPEPVPSWLATCGLVLFGYLTLSGVTVAAALVEGWAW